MKRGRRRSKEKRSESTAADEWYCRLETGPREGDEAPAVVFFSWWYSSHEASGPRESGCPWDVFELDFDFIREQLDVLLPLPPPSPVSLEAETCLGKATRGVSDGDCHFFFFIMED